MNISRRQFFIGGAAATGAFGAFGGNRFFAAAGFKAGGAPKLRFGVVSDIHITKVGADEKMEGWGNNLTFRHTLEWFRSQNVDAVVIAGDMADKGMVDQMEAVAQAWYAVFPDDRYPDGRPIEKVFVMGNHDYHGYLYGDYAAKTYPDMVERVKHVLRSDFATRWKRIFNEDYARFYCKKIKGYTFLGQHWDDGKGMETGHGSCDFGAELQAFLAAKGGTLDPSLPFFYVQHPHPKDTCYGPWAWGHDRGKVTQALSAYPNAIAFSGHSHYYENTSAEGKQGWRYNAVKLMRGFATGDCRQGMLWSVYDDCIVVKRREFLSNLDVGDDWVLPLPSAEPKPFAFAERAKKFRAPSFPAGAKLAVSTVKAKSRGGKSRDGKESLPSVEKSAFKVVVPAAVADKNARLYKLEFVAESKDGTKKTKLIMPEGFNHAVGHAKASAPSFCLFARDEFNGEVRFTVTPFNCFGARGTPLVSDWVANT